MDNVKTCNTCCNFYAGPEYKLCKECKNDFPTPTNYNVSESKDYMVINKQIWDKEHRG